MKSIREIYKIGKGPSSSHTMGPERAARLFLRENPDADAFRVILYGSLSKTDKHIISYLISYILYLFPICQYDHESWQPYPVTTHSIMDDRKAQERGQEKSFPSFPKTVVSLLTCMLQYIVTFG